jgi:hypothetical protein
MPEGSHQIPAGAGPRGQQFGKSMMIHPRQLAVGAVPMRAVDLFFRQFQQTVQVTVVALL